MRIGEQLLHDFSGGHSPADDVSNIGDALRVLIVEAGGSTSQLARDLGRPRRTVRNWLSGTTPKGGGDWLIDRAVRAQRRSWLPAADEDELRHGFDIVTIGGTLSVSDDEARVLELEFLPGYGDQLVDAYLDGANADEMEELFLGGVADDWYREHLGPDTWDTDWLGLG